MPTKLKEEEFEKQTIKSCEILGIESEEIFKNKKIFDDAIKDSENLKKNIESSYRRNSLKCHPDKFPSYKKKEQEFNNLTEAKEFLIKSLVLNPSPNNSEQEKEIAIKYFREFDFYKNNPIRGLFLTFAVIQNFFLIILWKLKNLLIRFLVKKIKKEIVIKILRLLFFLIYLFSIRKLSLLLIQSFSEIFHYFLRKSFIDFINLRNY